MTLVSDVTTAALARNRKNQPGIIATDTELLNAFRRIYPVFWTVGARVNPSFFGAREELDFDSESDPTGWNRPDDAELIFHLEYEEIPDRLEDDVTDPEIAIVPLDNREADPYTPALYEWGQVFYPAGNELDPDPDESEDIVCYYSKRPDEPEELEDELESLWPTQFDELLVLEMALLLAHKDERAQEETLLRQDRDVWLRRFIAHLEHATVPLRRSQGSAQRFTSQTWVPLNHLLTGGTEVDV